MEALQITQIALITALSQLKEPLSDEQQTDLASINLNQINELDQFAEKYPAFDQIYQDARAILEVPAVERSKSDFPIIDNESEGMTTEISNIVEQLEKKDSGDFSKMLDTILKAGDPRKTAQEELQSRNILISHDGTVA
ncbi:MULTISPECIES: hypothetical protein [Kamptonema]|uniref:hypothetical protein n=1 Tax=Kamptonema TaxID=1501433 RepID=UPI0001DAD0F3|nr:MULTISPECIES: hypothetical protein [Kamptonema]CBN58777.1 hypothetical protein OSCI_3880038 [Kamptonema sp. PCC 6506]